MVENSHVGGDHHGKKFNRYFETETNYCGLEGTSGQRPEQCNDQKDFGSEKSGFEKLGKRDSHMKNVIALLALGFIACGSNMESTTGDANDHNTNDLSFNEMVIQLDDASNGDHTMQEHARNVLQSAYDSLVACDKFKKNDASYYSRVANMGTVRLMVTDTSGVNCADSWSTDLFFIDGKCSST